MRSCSFSHYNLVVGWLGGAPRVCDLDVADRCDEDGARFQSEMLDFAFLEV